MFMDISVKYLHNDMIKQSGIGGLDTWIDYVTQKVLIIDTTLKSFISPQVRKVPHKLRHICGCKLCIIPKDMQIYLNIFRTILVTYLQQNYVGRHTRNILFSTTCYAHYKDKNFPCDECLHAIIKDSAQWIAYLPIKPKNVIHIKCALGFCDEFPGYNITDEELDGGPNTSIIHFSVYTYQGRCATHCIIPMDQVYSYYVNKMMT